MKRLALLIVLLAPLALLASAEGAPEERIPHVGYASPAGGAQGSTVVVTVGGQNLRGVKRVYVSGGDVTAAVVKYRGFGGRLNSDQRRELGQRLRRIVARKVAEQYGTDQDRRRAARRRANRPPPKKDDGKQGDGKKNEGKKSDGKKRDAKEEEPVVLPDHPLLRDLEGMTLRELKKVSEFFFDPTRRLQESPQIAEMVDIEVVIGPEAKPGDRELRLGTPLGLTNPVLFQVGLLPEFAEQEPNDFESSRQATVDLPVVLNGQVDVRDLDRFRFRAKKGQKLLIRAEARRLVPYLADAVPGWFQATMAVYDAGGRRHCYGDDYRFDPDPVLFFTVPETGDYELEIRDSIHRGREDFVYRITVGEEPFITRMFPLGGREGVETVAAVGGWNLPCDRLPLDTAPAAARFRTACWREERRMSNRVPYAVDDLPEILEAEPDDTRSSAQSIALPGVVNGRIDRAGDTDLYRFEGRKGDEVVAEVFGRRLGSPLDSVVRVADALGRVIAWNDDVEDAGMGLVTHHSDSRVSARLPSDGTYFVMVEDAQTHGGEAYAYRLHVGPPRPDFDLLVTPSALNVSAGAAVAFTVHAIRRDGFAGDIEVKFADLPAGYFLSGGRIPAGRDRVRMTLTAPENAPGLPLVARLEGRAEIGGKEVVREAVPCEDMMQAFGLRHLVATRELLVDVVRSWRGVKRVRMAGPDTVRIVPGGAGRARLRTPVLPNLENVRFVLSEPPPGIALAEVRPDRGGIELLLTAEPGEVEAGLEDNLIVDVYVDSTVGGRDGKPARKRTAYVGVLPAIPIRIEAGGAEDAPRKAVKAESPK